MTLVPANTQAVENEPPIFLYAQLELCYESCA